MERRIQVAGIDSSTQNCKLIVVDAATGELLSSSAIPHPEGSEINPAHWWDALHATGVTRLRDVAALSVTAQQHSTLFLDSRGDPVREALLWNDLRATSAGLALREEWGGPARWATDIGLLPSAAHPVSKLRWLRDGEPDVAAGVEQVMVPHDWLTWTLLDRAGEPTTDRSDASATGYWSMREQCYRKDLVELALGRPARTPLVLGPSERAGVTKTGMVMGVGCGDNAAASLGLHAEPGEAVVSIGTSLTVSATSLRGTADLSGTVDDMADATGLHLPMVATLNGARTIVAASRMLRVGLEELAGLSSAARPDAEGLTFLPYLDGERNPLLPDSSGALLGMTRRNMTPENIARASILGVAAAAAAAVEAMLDAGVTIRSLIAVGGAARLDSLCQAIADLTGRELVRPRRREYAALGAARQAAWALTGELPRWGRADAVIFRPLAEEPFAAMIRARHAHWTSRLFDAPGSPRSGGKHPMPSPEASG